MEDKIKRAFAFFLSAGGVIGIVSDVFTPVANFAGALVVPLLALTLVYALAERAQVVERALAAPQCPHAVKSLLSEYRGFPLLAGLLILTLMMVASSFITRASANEGGVVARYVPGVRELQQSLDSIGAQLAELTSATRELKKETSEDPRKELSNMGIEWTSAAFHDAVVRADFKALDLFVAGGMSLMTRMDGNPASPLYYAIARIEPNRIAVLSYFLDRGLDVNDNSVCVPDALGQDVCGNGTLLAIARAYRDEAAVDLLLGRGAEPDKVVIAMLKQSDYLARALDYYDSLPGDVFDRRAMAGCDARFGQQMAEAQLEEVLPRLTAEQVEIIRRAAAYICGEINVQPEFGPQASFRHITKSVAYDYLFLNKLSAAGYRLPSDWEPMRLPHEDRARSPEPPPLPSESLAPGEGRYAPPSSPPDSGPRPPIRFSDGIPKE
jgi:hypothetical protein